MRYLLILILLSACNQTYQEEPYLVIDDVTEYKIVTAKDSCQYYTMSFPSGYTKKPYYFHYPQCKWCKKHKHWDN